jgi:protein-S-isoprenylcysteine O-methyltransferase Ste14
VIAAGNDYLFPGNSKLAIYNRTSRNTFFFLMRSFLAAMFFSGLMVLGWGSTDFFSDIPRSIVFFSAILASFFSMSGATGTSRGKEQGESAMLFWVLVLLTVLAAFFLPLFSAHWITHVELPDAVRYFGSILLLGSLVFRIFCVRALKRQFSIYVAIQENHQLITTGIYSRIRHPIYLGAIVSLIGIELVFPTLSGFLFVVIYSMLLTHRMAQEERLMLKHFGSVYEEYISKSYRLIPNIY